MRLRHPDGSLLHLAYCSNVHPADDLDGVAAQLERYTARVRERLDVPVLGVGLWVAAPALADAAAADRLRRRSSSGSSLEVVTLNGFPYKAFHAPVVKRDVYWPHWAQDERRAYTLGLARLLAGCCPTTSRTGSISTLPLGWREGWDDAAQAAALRALADLAVELEALAARDRQADPARAGARARLHGRDDRAGVRRARPGSRRSGSASASTPATSRCSSRTRSRRSRAARRGRADRQDAGLVARCASDAGSPEGRELLARFDEPRFLHQVRERVNSHVEGTDDLPEALDGGLPGAARVARALPRAGQHAPSTRRRTSCATTLAALAGGDAPLTRHFEVETYTWSVMRDAPTRRRGARGRAGRRAGMDARPAGRAGSGGGRHDAGGHRRGGAHPRALEHMPRVSKLGADGFQARAGPDRPRGHLLRPGDVRSPA